MTLSAPDASRQSVTSSVAYRKDIDGLRAVAVMLVIAYHFGIARISGGYIGVDLFFVISGFLIASIFNGEPKLSFAFLANFLNRRIKRLMPAFVLVAAVTTVAAAGLLLPEDFDAYLKSVRESLVFRANLFFERETTGYFAADSAALPWLHTWSLSVEWTFYFAFPFFVWLLRALPSRRVQTWGMAAATFVGVVVSIRMTQAQPAHAYFSALARFFEFLTGALATAIAFPRLGSRTSTAISGLGIAALVVLSGIFVGQTPFPGLNALAVCALAFILVVVGRNASMLSQDWLARLGKLSYSAYLWHWPVIAFLSYVQRKPSGVEAAFWIAAIFLASELSYRLVERPGQAATFSLPASFGLYGLLPFLIASSLYMVVRNHDGFPQRLGKEASHAYANLQRFDSPDADRCHDHRSSDIQPCVIGDPSAPVAGLLIGDSHARQFRPFVRVLAEAAHVKVYGLTNSECLTLEGVQSSAELASRQACNEAIERDFKLIRSGRFKFVLIAERWIGYPNEQLDRLDGSLRAIVESGAIPILFKSVAENGENPKDCFYLHIKIRRPFAERCTIQVDNAFAAASKRHVIDLIDSMRARYPSLRIIDPQAVQCDRLECATVFDDTPIYGDKHHLNAFGSTMLAQDYLSRFGNPLESLPH